jgi:hypothetical protein
VVTRRFLISTVAVLGIVSGATLLAQAAAPEFKTVPDWLKLADGKPTLGNMHGDIAVSSKGEVYVSVQDPQAGLQVYAPDGTFLRNVPEAPSDFHGFIIHREAGGEFLYGVTLRGQTIVKMSLDGKVAMTIPASAIPDDFKVRNARSGQLGVLLTGLDVAPNGDLYVADGYASDYIHRFDRTGKYLTSFGGKKAPYNFNTLHKLAIDTRFQPARIIACDRANNRVLHLSLDGELRRRRQDLLLPAAIVVSGDYAIVGELRARSACSTRRESSAGSARTRKPAPAPISSSPSSGAPGSSPHLMASPSTNTAICSCRSSTSTDACCDSIGSSTVTSLATKSQKHEGRTKIFVGAAIRRAACAAGRVRE